MGTVVNTTTPASFFSGLESAEITLIKGPIVTDLTALQQPNVNFQTALGLVANIQLQALQLSLPAQTVLLNYVSTWLLSKINTAPTV